MKSLNVPKELQERVRMWFAYNWEHSKTLGMAAAASSCVRCVVQVLAPSFTELTVALKLLCSVGRDKIIMANND